MDDAALLDDEQPAGAVAGSSEEDGLVEGDVREGALELDRPDGLERCARGHD